jgi:hypothetical protein
MKNLTRILLLSSLIFAVNFIYAQSYSSYETKKIIAIDGSEESINPNPTIIHTSGIDQISPVFGDFYTYTFHNITDRKTGYDFQSNASTQQVWLDLNNPDFLHSVFTNSQEATVWSDRTCLYFGSTDAGVTWFELGPVPTTTRSGFPAIFGNSNGAAVITNHHAVFGLTRATVMIDNSPFEYNFTIYDPGTLTEGDPIWPRHTVTLDDNVIFAASQNGPDSLFVNVLDPSIPAFFGYHGIDGEQAESYALATSNSGKIGLAYNGQAPFNDGDVYYIESIDGGLTWSSALKIFDRPDLQDTAMGGLRGVDVNFYGEQPSVVFEICTQIFSSGNFFPGLPSEILFWSPIVNGGNSFAIADSFNVPFAPSVGTNDVQVPICRPVIGRSETGGFLFVAFDVATNDVYPSADTTTYFAGYFMLSSDGGNNWTVPEKFTPDGPPLLDWRYISIAPISPVVGDLCTVHMVVQGDTLPGSTLNAAGMPVGVTAQYYHVSTEPIPIPVELISFTANLIEPNVVLNWQTATETNNMGFEIQRKLIQEELSGEWVFIGYKEGAGTITEPQEYSYYDNIKNIEATSFVYRLKQVDYDGSYEFSNEITIENSTLPDKFSLLQNYPNPFNPATSIKFKLPVKSFVSLVVYDVLGNEVATLVKEEKPAGFYEVNFNANNLVSGVYIYRLQANSFIQTKKMILMK